MKNALSAHGETTEDECNERTERRVRQGKKDADSAAAEGKKPTRDKKMARRAKEDEKRVKKKPTTVKKDLLAEMDDFTPNDLRSFMLWRKTQSQSKLGVKPDAKSKTAANLPSAPRGNRPSFAFSLRSCALRPCAFRGINCLCGDQHIPGFCN